MATKKSTKLKKNSVELKEIILHVGHGKTGSSYLQSTLAINRKNLLEVGIDYPEHVSFIFAKKGDITSGNSEIFINNYLNLEAITQKQYLLFSGEDLFRKLIYSDWFKTFAKKYSKKLKVIIYTRNLFSYSFSRWGQAVKRSKEILDLDSYFQNASYESAYKILLEWIQLERELNFKLLIRNYSNHKDNLIDTFFKDAFDITQRKIKLNLIDQKQVNRSLTFSEYEIQRVLNYLKLDCRPVSDFLINELPNIKSMELKCSKKTYEIIKLQNIDFIKKINKKLESDELIIIESQNKIVYNNENEFRPLSINQIKIIASFLEKYIQLNNIGNNIDIDKIRDIAFNIYAKKRMDKSEALSLMKIAYVLRPNGPLISQTIEKWQNKLERRKTFFRFFKIKKD